MPNNPDDAFLEKLKSIIDDYMVRFTCRIYFFVSMTSQIDFAHLTIDYVPDKYLVESKSLKLYLFSFRNHGAFHEFCTVDIAKKLVELLAPKWLRIGGYWYPRGGIPIDVFYQTGEPPKNVWIKEQMSQLSWAWL